MALEGQYGGELEALKATLEQAGAQHQQELANMNQYYQAEWARMSGQVEVQATTGTALGAGVGF